MSTFLEFNLFTLLIFVAVGLMAWFLIAREIGSTRRMTCMKERMGLEYDLAVSADPGIEAVIANARDACLRCRSEGLCERWLDVAPKGEAFTALLAEAAAGPASAESEMRRTRADDFCPNAATFRALAFENQLNGPLQAPVQEEKEREEAI